MKKIPKLISFQTRAKSAEDLLKTVLVRIPPVTLRWAGGQQTFTQGLTALHLYTGAIAQPLQYPGDPEGWFRLSESSEEWASLPVADMRRHRELSALKSAYQSQVTRERRIRFTSFGDLGLEGKNLLFDNLVSDEANRWGEFNQPMSRPVPARPGLVGADPMAMMGGGIGGGFEAYNPRLEIGYESSIDLDEVFGLEVMPGKDVDGKLITNPYRTRGYYVEVDPGNNDFWFTGNNDVWLTRSILNAENLKKNPSRADFLPSVDLVATPGNFALEMNKRIVSVNQRIRSDWPVNGTIVGQASAGEFDPFSQLATNPQGSQATWSIGRFGDLAAHAPGLNTLPVDILAALETQGPAEWLPERGTIDPKAQSLIDRARRQGWQTVALPSEKSEAKHSIRCDGQGRYVYERTLSEGLKERVLCDGETLWHVYEELGLAARRTVSRFHRAELQRWIPWHMPPAEDLAVGCDVKFVDEHTIALVPLAEEKADEENSTPPAYVLMIFGDEGQLKERRLVDSETNKPLRRITYDANGAVSVFDQDGQRIAQVRWQRKHTKAADVKPELQDLVVLSLPHRTPESFLTPEQQNLANSSQHGALEDDVAVDLLGSYYASGNAAQLTQLLQQRFFGQEDHRIGLYVLLASVYQHTGYANQAAQLRQQHPDSALAEYLAQHFEWTHTGNTQQDFIITGREEGFLPQLAMARNLYVGWQTRRAVQNRSATEIRAERQRGLQSLKKLQTPSLAWQLLIAMQAADTDPDGLSDYIQAAEEFADQPGLSLVARFQAAYWRSEHGDTAEAVRQLEALSEELHSAGVLPPINEAMRNAFINHAGIKAWAGYLEDLQSQLLKEDARLAALRLAMQAAAVKKDHLSARLLKAALQDLDTQQDPLAALLAVGHLMAENQYAEAERLLAPLLKAQGWSQQPPLWRKAAEIAQQQGQEALSVARMERALQLEYEALPEVINLQFIRNEYGSLLARLQTLAAQEEPAADLKQRAIRIADCWRVLDPEDTAPCQAAARILAELGEEELAWDYLTTPLAEKPNEAAPWQQLAQELASQNKIDLADRAYAQTYNAEQTNAEILWIHAEMLRQHDREEAAQELLEKITAGTWQPRFNNIKAQAEQRLNELLRGSDKTP